MDEESIDIAAPPEKVWALLTDVTNMGRWSPECQRCEWVAGASAPVVGAKFKGHNKRGLSHSLVHCAHSVRASFRQALKHHAELSAEQVGRLRLLLQVESN